MRSSVNKLHTLVSLTLLIVIVASPLSFADIQVYIDPGHGGTDVATLFVAIPHARHKKPAARLGTAGV